MSSHSDIINTWVPATVVGLFVSLLGACIWACIWDLCRRRYWTFWARFFPWILREVRLDQEINLPYNIVSNLPNRNVVEQGDLEVNQNLEESMRSPIVIEELRSSDSVQPRGHSISNEQSASSSNVNTIGPTHETIDMVRTHHDTEERVSVAKRPIRSPDIVQPGGHSSIIEEPASSSNVNTIRPAHHEIIHLSDTHHDSEGRVSLMDFTSQYVGDNIAYVDSYAHMDSTPSSNSSSSVFMATLYLAGSLPMSFVSQVKERLENIANRPIWQWKSSVVLQGRLSTDPVVLAKAVKLLNDCVQVDKSCTLQLGTWGILYFKGTSFTNFTLTFILVHFL
jgi:hypothetical protein